MGPESYERVADPISSLDLELPHLWVLGRLITELRMLYCLLASQRVLARCAYRCGYLQRAGGCAGAVAFGRPIIATDSEPAWHRPIPIQYFALLVYHGQLGLQVHRLF